jgi:pheromone receptor transcription factor
MSQQQQQDDLAQVKAESVTNVPSPTPQQQLHHHQHEDDYQPQDTQLNSQAQVESNSNNKPKRAGRRKINIEFIKDKSRRHITFSKRKAGIMKKAYELSTLTGTQVLLLVASETGHVYTFATPKLQPLITKTEGKNLIQACLNAPDMQGGDAQMGPDDQGGSMGDYSGSELIDDEVETKQPPPQKIKSMQMSYGGPPQAQMNIPPQNSSPAPQMHQQSYAQQQQQQQHQQPSHQQNYYQQHGGGGSQQHTQLPSMQNSISPHFTSQQQQPSIDSIQQQQYHHYPNQYAQNYQASNLQENVPNLRVLDNNPQSTFNMQNFSQYQNQS